MIQALFNNCLIELVDDYAGIARSSANERVQKGYLRECMLISDHLTTSTGYRISALDEYAERLYELKGKLVYYQEYADSGAVFERDGKKWALVPWWRLIGFEDVESKLNKDKNDGE